MQVLPLSLCITVPEKLVNTFGFQQQLLRLAVVAGGYTITDGFGGWRAPDGELVEEEVALVSCYFTADQAKRVETAFADVVLCLLASKEHTVLVTGHVDMFHAARLYSEQDIATLGEGRLAPALREVQAA